MGWNPGKTVFFNVIFDRKSEVEKIDFLVWFLYFLVPQFPKEVK